MALEQFKDVEIEGRRYRIGSLSALVGNWIATVMMQRKATDEETFAKIQAHCLEVCQRYEERNGERTPINIFAKPDRFLVPDLAHDVVTVSALQEEVLDFNLGSFFAKLKTKLESVGAQAGT